AQTVEQFMMPIANFKKPELLQALLEEKGSDRVIVFARTKNRTEDCAEALCDAGYRAESIHSDKSQGQRKRAL
ncbi:DEAD/DEAH box helicase, partial [Bifidobacterium breve]|nr:DEAD/DEAH box helicase [Bifidobacterium breve]